MLSKSKESWGIQNNENPEQKGAFRNMCVDGSGESRENEYVQVWICEYENNKLNNCRDRR